MYLNKMVEKKEYVNELKDNYAKRIEEVDHTSKRLVNASGDLNTEFLYGSLNIAHQFVDMQEKYLQNFPILLSKDLTLDSVKRNTEAWINTVQNIDSANVESLKNARNLLKAINRNFILYLQSLERIYDFYDKVQSEYNEKVKPKEIRHMKREDKPLIRKETS